MIELRCGKAMHGKLDDGLLEVKCKRRGCGAKPGVIVLHTFDIVTGDLVGTKRYADPVKERISGDNDAHQHAALRTA